MIKNSLLTLLFTMLWVGKTHTQEVKHAPTVEQCRADQRLWLDKLEGSSASLPNYLTLAGWFHEMHECKSVDPENQRRYYNVCGEISSEQFVRLTGFLERHGLYDKFIEEDAAGKR